MSQTPEQIAKALAEANLTDRQKRDIVEHMRFIERQQKMIARGRNRHERRAIEHRLKRK